MDIYLLLENEKGIIIYENNFINNEVKTMVEAIALLTKTDRKFKPIYTKCFGSRMVIMPATSAALQVISVDRNAFFIRGKYLQTPLTDTEINGLYAATFNTNIDKCATYIGCSKANVKSQRNTAFQKLGVNNINDALKKMGIDFSKIK